VGVTSIVIEVEIEKWVYGGAGLSRTDGQVLLTPFVLPGERVRVEPLDKLNARLLEVVTASPVRRAAPCRHFESCGGCQYQHAPYDLQLKGKVEILLEQLRRVGKIEPSVAIRTLAGEEFGYRNRTQFHQMEGRVGYFAEGTHDLVPIESCPISSPAIQRAYAGIRPLLPRFVRRFELFTNEQETLVNILDTERPVAKRFFEACAAQFPGADQPALDYPVGSDRFQVTHSSFFQVNRFLVAPLVELALEGAEGESAFDLYCGVGLFSVPLARRFAQVTAVELGNSAWRDLKFNAERAGVSVKAVRNRAEDYLAGVTEAPDFVLADPPRSGLGKAAVSELLRLRPRQLTIISCDPATLARDLNALLAGYTLETMTLVDLFPQTLHLETVVRLKSRNT
jgi:23S rRNA (uracil1939-C5)-methyltransferase